MEPRPYLIEGGGGGYWSGSGGCEGGGGLELERICVPMGEMRKCLITSYQQHRNAQHTTHKPMGLYLLYNPQSYLPCVVMSIIMQQRIAKRLHGLLQILIIRQFVTTKGMGVCERRVDLQRSLEEF